MIVLGRDAERVAQAMPETVPVERVSSITEAVNRAAQLAQSGDSVLLAPACASWDMFKSFEERGDVFAQAVEDLL